MIRLLFVIAFPFYGKQSSKYFALLLNNKWIALITHKALFTGEKGYLYATVDIDYSVISGISHFYRLGPGVELLREKP